MKLITNRALLPNLQLARFQKKRSQQSLVMGFTGAKAAAMKEAFIAQYSAMRERLAGRRKLVEPQDLELDRLLNDARRAHQA
jgi:phage regulator Rha-like protein